MNKLEKKLLYEVNMMRIPSFYIGGRKVTRADFMEVLSENKYAYDKFKSSFWLEIIYQIFSFATLGTFIYTVYSIFNDVEKKAFALSKDFLYFLMVIITVCGILSVVFVAFTHFTRKNAIDIYNASISET